MHDQEVELGALVGRPEVAILPPDLQSRDDLSEREALPLRAHLRIEVHSGECEVELPGVPAPLGGCSGTLGSLIREYKRLYSPCG